MLNLDKSKYYLLACSYGPDSMALLHMLKSEGFNFLVAHVNYGIRKEAKEETDALNTYCANNDIEIEMYFAKDDIKGGNFEAKAREIRYNFFKKIYDERKCDALLVGHQQDDLIETYYLQRKRGGYIETFGIAYDTNIFGMEVIRPLLEYTKADLSMYCFENNVPYMIDSTNLNNDFSRNIIRHTIVEKMNPRERKFMVNEINEKNIAITNIYTKLSNLDIHNKNVLLNLNEEEYYRALHLLIREIDQKESLSIKLMDEIKKIILSSKPNVNFPIRNNLILIKEYDYISFIKENKDELYAFVIDKPKKFETQYFYLDFSLTHGGKNIKEEDYPLTIRSPKDGDSVLINNYRCELRRLFIDWKMPSSLRKRWPIIVSKNGQIIYVPRYRKDFPRELDPTFYVKTK